MQKIYSYYGSPLHFPLEVEIAERFNRFVKAFYAAQLRFKEENGRPWTPDETLKFENVSKKDEEAYNNVGKVINLLVKINGGGLDITEEQMTSDYLEEV